MTTSFRRAAIATAVAAATLLSSPAQAVGITPWTTEADIPTGMWGNAQNFNSEVGGLDASATNSSTFQVAYKLWHQESSPWPAQDPTSVGIEIALPYADFELCADPFVACADGVSLIMESPDGKTFDAEVVRADLVGEDFDTSGMNGNPLWPTFENPAGVTISAVQILVTNADNTADDFRGTVVILTFPAGSVTMPTAEQALYPTGAYSSLTIHTSAFANDNMTGSRSKLGASQTGGIVISDGSGANESGAGVDDLAATGVDMVPGLIGAGALIAAGITVAAIRRRRASRD
ncbi:hypothetical protein C8A06_0494 [Microbacteriaceae bacterium MWH-Ta3]|nr:hypothetical protein C8A06_0494 [Microbacteriaceae bacterium MWH-Ta3]